jgi:hypothetical protein
MDLAVHNGHLFQSARPPRETHLVFYFRLVPLQQAQPVQQTGEKAADKNPAPSGPAFVWQLWSDELKTLPSLSREIAVNELFIQTAESISTSCPSSSSAEFRASSSVRLPQERRPSLGTTSAPD